MSRVPRVLSIAGTDPTGGAGLQADLKSIAVHDGYGMGVVTALVAQNTHGVRAVHVPDTAFLRAQLDAVSDDVTIDAVKIGMLGTAPVIRTVTAWLAEHRPRFVVLDPVMVATSGDRLLDEDATAAMDDLLGLADLVTPNRAELEVLRALAEGAASTPNATDTAATDAAATDAAATDAAAAGPAAVEPATDLDAALLVADRWGVLVLAKGGHDDDPTEAVDVLVRPGGASRRFSGPRIRTRNTHGTGCSLSSAIATLVARHGDWEVAVGIAKTWMTTAILGADALAVGSGHGPIDHGAALRAHRPDPRYVDAWWHDVGTLLGDVVACDFVRGLGSGSLDADVFAAYLAQDVHYLRAYAGHLAAVGTGAPDPAFWHDAAEGCEREEQDLHRRRLAGTHAEDPVHEVTAGYLAHLDAAAASGSTAVLAAAVLPCFQVYAHVGVALSGDAVPASHPYADWLTAYSDEGFAASSVAATAAVEAFAAAADVEERGAMAAAFRTSVAWELAFFRMPDRLGEHTDA